MNGDVLRGFAAGVLAVASAFFVTLEYRPGLLLELGLKIGRIAFDGMGILVAIGCAVGAVALLFGRLALGRRRR